MRKRDKKTRVLVLIIVILLVAALVVPMLAAAIKAESESAEKSESTVESVSESASENSESGSSESEDAAVLTAENTDGDATGSEKLQGVFIENIDTTGMSLEEIEAAVANKMKEVGEQTVSIYTDHEERRIKAADLGLDYRNKNIAREAYSIGKSGNVFRRFLADSYRKDEPIILDLDYQVSQTAIHQTMTESKKVLDRAPVPTGLKHETDGSFSLVEKVDGVEVDSSSTALALENYMNNEWTGGEGGIRATYKVLPSQDRSEELKGVKDLLGTWSTQYDLQDENRTINVQLSTEIINGMVLFPGDEFNFEEVVGEQTEERGFRAAGSYENGRVVDTLGGGICQTSSTLYMAVLSAELEVTQRHPHTMTVTYLEPGMDAGISEGELNFKFKNSNSTPIYIEGITEGDTLTFNIYGVESRPAGRTIRFESRELSRTSHGRQFRYKSDLDYGQVEHEYGHDGVVAELWKIISVPGEEDVEERINYNQYFMSDEVYYVGSNGMPSDAVGRINAAIATGEPSLVYGAIW